MTTHSANTQVIFRGTARVPSPIAIFHGMFGDQPDTDTSPLDAPKLNLRASTVVMAITGALVVSVLLSAYASLSVIEAVKSGLATIF